MLGKHYIRSTKKYFLFESRIQSLSVKPSATKPDSNISSTLVGVTLGFSTFGIGYLSYRIESDDAFSAYYESSSYKPFLNPILSPVRNIVKGFGLIKKSNPPSTKSNELHDVVSEEIINQDIGETPFEEHVHPLSEEPEPLAAAKASAEAKERATVNTIEISSQPEIPRESSNDLSNYVEEEIINQDIGETPFEEHAHPLSQTTASAPTNQQIFNPIPTEASPPVASEESPSTASAIRTPSVTSTPPPVQTITPPAANTDLDFPLDLHGLSEEDLRQRVILLHGELVNRTRWEAVRLQQTAKQIEQDTQMHYSQLAEKNALEAKVAYEQLVQQKDRAFQEELQRRTAAVQEELDAKLKETLRSQAEGFAASLQKELKAQESKLVAEAEESETAKLAELKQQQVKKTMPLLLEMEVARAELAVFKEHLSAIDSNRKMSSSAHALSAATLLLSKSLQTSDPISQELDLLKKGASGAGTDEVISLAISSIPEQAAKHGVPTTAELAVTFSSLQHDIRSAALAPEAAPLVIGQLIGGFLANISWAPSGYVTGDTTEDTIARVTFLLNFGDLAGAVAELENIKGKARKVVAGWEQSAKSRLAADQAVKAIKSAAALRHLQLVHQS